MTRAVLRALKQAHVCPSFRRFLTSRDFAPRNIIGGHTRIGSESQCSLSHCSTRAPSRLADLVRPYETSVSHLRSRPLGRESPESLRFQRARPSRAAWFCSHDTDDSTLPWAHDVEMFS